MLGAIAGIVVVLGIGMLIAHRLEAFRPIQLCREKDSGLNVERWGDAAYRQSLSQSLTIWRRGQTQEQSQYAVTAIRRAEKTNREKRSCVMQETPKRWPVPIKKQSRLAEYNAGGFATLGPDGKCPVQSGYRFRATLQRNSFVKLNASAAG